MAGPRLLLLNSLIPVQKWMQKIGNPEPRISSRFVQDLCSTMLPGDILLSREEWRLTNPFVPGFWGHAAMVTELGILEAIGSGVRIENFHRWAYSKDHIALIRPFLAEAVRREASNKAMEFLDLPYDFLFNKDTKAFYCSELIANAYYVVTGGEFEFYPRVTLGVETVVPQDFYQNAIRTQSFALIMEEIN